MSELKRTVNRRGPATALLAARAAEVIETHLVRYAQTSRDEKYVALRGLHVALQAFRYSINGCPNCGRIYVGVKDGRRVDDRGCYVCRDAELPEKELAKPLAFERPGDAE